MSIKNDKIYNCSSCNKTYKSYMGFWKHNKKYHNNVQNNDINKMSTNGLLLSTNGLLLSTSGLLLSTSGLLLSTNKKSNVLHCKYCNEIFNIRQTRWKHEQKCQLKNNIKIENDKLRALCAQAETIWSQKYEIELLKKNNNNQIITTNNTNNSNNNNINNTINIVKFGNERLGDVLSKDEMFKITEYINNSINESIKQVHFNDKRPELKNIMIKNLKDKNIYIFDGQKFIVDNKYRNLYELIDNHIYNIQTFINNNKSNFNENHLMRLEKFLRLVENDAKCTINNTKYNSYYDYKVDDINTLIYNLCKNE
jgi:hypothetical protein